MLTSELSRTVGEMVAPQQTNDGRRRCMDAICALQRQLHPTQYLAQCLELVQAPACDPAARNFAAHEVAALVRRGDVAVDHVPFAAMAQYVATTADLPAVVAAGIAVVARDCALLTWPTGWSDMLDTLCPVDLAARHNLLVVLEAVVTALADPPMSLVPRDRLGPVRTALLAATDTLLQRVVGALGQLHGQLRAVLASSGSTGGLLASLERGVNIVAALLPLTGPAVWWAQYIGDMVGALLSLPQTATHATQVLEAMCQCGKLDAADPKALEFLRNVMSALPSQVGAWEMVDVAVAALLAVDATLVTAAVDAFVSLAVVLLRTASIRLAGRGFDILSRCHGSLAVVPESYLSEVVSLTHRHIRKVVSNPELSDTEEARCSREQFASQTEYDNAFGDLRNCGGATLKAIAAAHPTVSLTAALQMIRGLTPPTATDQRHPRFGWITQRSAVFVEWDACLFCVDQLAAAIADPRAASTVAQLQAVLMAQQNLPTDATLAPVYLSLLSALWPANVPHWQRTVEVIFAFMELPPFADGARIDFDDEDLIAARKRAHTLLVNAASKYGAHVTPYAGALVGKIQELLVTSRALPSETAFLFESAAALSNHMTSAEQEGFLSTLIGVHKDSVRAIAAGCTPERLALVLIAETRELMDERTQLRDSLAVLTAVMKRCDSSPYVTILAGELLSSYGALVMALHQMGPHVPPRLSAILEDDPEDRRIMATGERKRPPNRGQIWKLRSFLHGTRQVLYQGIGAMTGLMQQVPPFLSDLCRVLTEAHGSVSSTRMLCEACLIPSLATYPPIAAHMLPLFPKFFDATLQRSEGAHSEADLKSLSFLQKDILRVVRERVVPAATDPTVFGAVVDFYSAMLRVGVSPRDVTRDVLPLCSDTSKPHAQHFVGLIAQTAATHPRYLDVERRVILENVAEVYLKHFPAFDAALTAVVGEQVASAVKATLVATQRPDIKRRKFRDAVLAHFGVGA